MMVNKSDLGSVLRLLVVAAVVATTGCSSFRDKPENGAYRVERVEGCAGVVVAGNVVVNYGLVITDCDGARAIMENMVAENPYVTIETPRCALHGSGENARFRCGDGGVDIPEVVGANGVPVRDGQGRIQAVIFDDRHHSGDLALPLLTARVAELTAECQAKVDDDEHYCAIYANNIRLTEQAVRGR